MAMEAMAARRSIQKGGPIFKIEDPVQPEQISWLKAALKLRIPKSANMYNMTLLYPSFKDKMEFYVFDGQNRGAVGGGGGLSKLSAEKTWIFILYFREDYGPELSISAPAGCTTLPVEIKTAFEDKGTTLIDWSKPYEIVSVDEAISKYIIEIAKGQTAGATGKSSEEVEVYHCNHYYAAAKFMAGASRGPISTEMTLVDLHRTERLPPGVELKPLTASNGPRLLYDTWDYAKEGSEHNCTDIITKCPFNSAIYVQGSAASWMCMTPSGYLGPLFTLEQHRGHGYAQLVTRDMVVKLLESGQGQGFVPCSMVDVGNGASNAVHAGAGMRVTHLVHFIIFGRVSNKLGK